MKGEKFEDKSICIIEVNENLRRVRMGLPLTRPLSILNQNCKFQQKFEEIEEFSNPTKKCRGCYTKILINRVYCSNECEEYRKRYDKIYSQRPENKVRLRKNHKKYHQRPEVKERIKEYNQRLEVKARRKELHRLYNLKKKIDEVVVL